MLKACVSGSFRRHMDGIAVAVADLASHSVTVLSPADPRVVASDGEFLFVASDPVRSVRLVQDRHLEAIRAADFLWLVTPDGYVGQSASMEIGFASAFGVPILATNLPSDLTLRQYVTPVATLTDALQSVLARSRQRRPEGLLINPRASVHQAHQVLERLEVALTRPSSIEPVPEVHRGVSDLRKFLRLPTSIH